MKGALRLAFFLLFSFCLFGINVQAKGKGKKYDFEYCRKDISEAKYEFKVNSVKISPGDIDKTKPWKITATISYDSPDREFQCANKKLRVIVGFDEQVFNLCEKISKVEESTFVISHTVPPSDWDPIYVFLVITNGDDRLDVAACVRVDLFDKPPTGNENGHIFLPSDTHV